MLLCLFFGPLTFPLYSQIGSEYAAFTAFHILVLLLHGDQKHCWHLVIVLMFTGILFDVYVTRIASMTTHGHIFYIFLLVPFLAKFVAQACMLCLLYCHLEQDLPNRLSNMLDYIFPCNDEKLFCSDTVRVPAPDDSSDSHCVFVSGSVCIGFNPSQTTTECCYH